MAVQHRQQHRQPVLFQPHRDTAWVGQRRRIHQRLYFHQQRTRAFAGNHHAASRLLRAATGQEDRRRIGHFLQAFLAHREYAEFIDRAKAVLECAQHAEAAAALALEIQHRVHHVLQHPRARDTTFLGDMTDQEYGGAGFLGVAHQSRRAFAHLANRAGCRGQ